MSRAAGLARASLLALLIAVGAVGPALAVQPDEILPDSRLEARARGISGQLRCLVCQNQSIDDSDAPLARDLRVLVRDRLKQGESDTEVRDYVVARYGEFVLLRPVFAWHTMLLWLGPAFVLLAGLAGLLARRRRRSISGPLTSDEQGRISAILRETDG